MISGRTSKNTKTLSGTLCLIDMVAVHNLAKGVSVNHCLVPPKGNVVPVIVVNQNNHNVWLWQPLLVVEIIHMENLQCNYGIKFHQKGQNIELVFQPIPLAEIIASLQAVYN